VAGDIRNVRPPAAGITRRAAIRTAALATPGLLLGRSALADALAQEAAGLGPVIWYESTPDELANRVGAVFQKRYPKVQIRHVRDTGGNAMSARIIQESQGDARTADIGTNSPSIFWPLVQRDLLEQVDWAALGAAPRMAPTPYSLLTTASVYVMLANTQLVSEADRPTGWDALLDPRWKGKLGTWQRTEAFVSLAAAWGANRVATYLERLSAQQPFLFPSTFPLAQQIAAGEVSVGLGIYHSAQPAILRGAPIRFAVPEPAPISSLYSFIPKGGRNRPGGRLFALWLATEEGALAYEAATSRGNPLVAATRTAQLLAGHTVAEQRPDDADATLKLIERYDAILRQGGRDSSGH